MASGVSHNFGNPKLREKETELKAQRTLTNTNSQNLLQ
jgi:hypothetical protein